MSDEAPTAPAASIIKHLDELLGLVQKPQTFAFDFGGGKIHMAVRALTCDQWAEVRKTGADLKPPQKFKDKDKKIPVPGEVDEDDPDYQKAVTNAYELRRVHALSLALVGLLIPGDTLDDKLAWLKASLPPNLINALFAAVSSLTSDPIPLAHFITVAP